MVVEVVLMVMLGLFIFDGIIWLAMLGNLNRICEILRSHEEKT